MNKINSVLCIDIGNSRTKAALFHDGTIETIIPPFNNSFWVDGNVILPEAALTAFSCVNPFYTRFAKSYLAVRSALHLSIDDQLNLGFTNKYISRAGSDRLANASAASFLYPDENVMVIDAGSAVNIDIIEKGFFMGGAILPGLKTSYNTLINNTAIADTSDFSIPLKAAGLTTEENIRSGIYFGTAGAIKYLHEAISAERGNLYRTVATGGDSFLTELVIPDCIKDSEFTLKGIYRIASLNHSFFKIPD